MALDGEEESEDGRVEEEHARHGNSAAGPDEAGRNAEWSTPSGWYGREAEKQRRESERPDQQ